MIHFIYGGSGSGKSAYAEKWVLDYGNPHGKSYYLATMEVYDREGQARVEKHRQMRQDKGFLTAEHPRRIEEILQNPITGEDTILLECLSNLVANEMFCYTEETGDDMKGNSFDTEVNTDDMKENSFDTEENRDEIKSKPVMTVVEDIWKGILQIEEAAGQLCIVGNDIFRESSVLTPEMEAYVKALGTLQNWVAARAESVTEVVYGVPIKKYVDAGRKIDK